MHKVFRKEEYIMPKYREILRLYNQGISKTSIARTCQCSRTTVTKVIQAIEGRGYTWSQIANLTEEDLKQWMTSQNTEQIEKRKPDFEKIHRELMKNGVTLSLLWNEYTEECRNEQAIPLRYSQFCHLYRQYALTNKATMTIHRKPGELIEVDWAGNPMAITDNLSGEQIPVNVFVGVLPFSQYGYVEGFLNRSEESWIEAHNHMYQFFGGVTKILVPDNLKTGISKHSKEDVIVQKSYQEMAEHYGTVVMPTRVSAPQDKASVEKSVNIVSTWIIASLRNRKFFSLGELNEAIKEKLIEYNTKPFQKKEGNRQTIFLQEEKEYLLPLPNQVYELATWKVAIVPFNYHISVDKMHYSVPYEYIKHEVEVRVTSKTIEIFFNQIRIASHPRLFGRINQYQTNMDHMPDNHKSYLQWNKERFLAWGEKIGTHTHAMVEQIFKLKSIEQQGYRTAMALLKLADKYSIERLEKACEKAFSLTVHPSYQHVKMILQTGQDKAQEKILPKKVNKDNPHGFVRGAAYYGGKKND